MKDTPIREHDVESISECFDTFTKLRENYTAELNQLRCRYAKEFSECLSMIPQSL